MENQETILYDSGKRFILQWKKCNITVNKIQWKKFYITVEKVTVKMFYITVDKVTVET